MTKTLASTAIALAFVGTPALAGHHEEGNKDTMAKKHEMLKKEHVQMKNDSDVSMIKTHVKAHEEHSVKHAEHMMSETSVEGTSNIEGDMIMDSEDRVGQILQTDNMAGKDSPGEEVMMYDGEVEDKMVVKAEDDDGQIKDNAVVVPSLTSETITTVTCPPGTEAQENMTCLITGDFDFD